MIKHQLLEMMEKIYLEEVIFNIQNQFPKVYLKMY